MAEKIGIIRSKKAMQAANGRSCVNCGAMDGTIVRAHYTGLRQHLFGAGRGIKCHDICTADLCMKCHSAFDTFAKHLKRTGEITKIDQSEQFLYLIMETIIRDVKEGVLKYA